MKVVIKVKRNSQFAYLNGLTLRVIQVLSRIIEVEIPDKYDPEFMKTCDFTFEEVEIVDFKKEIQDAYDQHNWNGGGVYNKLVNYAKSKNILFRPTYFCPA